MALNKFKKEDQVKCIDATNCAALTKNKIYTIVETTTSDYTYVTNDVGSPSVYYSHRFELADRSLTITKEAVLKAANESPQSLKLLKNLFPDVFPEDKSIDLSNAELNGTELYCNFKKMRLMTIFNNSRFYLNPSYNWKIEGEFLIPTKK